MDVYTRNIRGWQLKWSSGQELTLEALNQALQSHPAPEIPTPIRVLSMPDNDTSLSC